MKSLYLVPALLLLSLPAQATLWKYDWKGVVDYGDDPKEVSGSFRYDDAAEVIWDHEGQGPEVQFNAVDNINLVLGDHFYTMPGKWDAYRTTDGQIGFSDVGLENGRDRLWWQGDKWILNAHQEDFSVREIGGKIVSFYKTGWTPDLPGRDANPVPEPSSLVLMASALLGFAGIRGYRKKYRHSR